MPKNSISKQSTLWGSLRLDYYVYCCNPFLKIDKNTIVAKPEPTERTSILNTDMEYKIDDFNLIRAKIDKNNYAIPEIELGHKINPEITIIIKFNKRFSMQFSLLLFLIRERLNKEIDWLKMEFPDMREFDEFQQICSWCSIPSSKLEKMGWWDDPINEKRKGYVREINQKLNTLKIQGEVIVNNPNINGVYNLNSCLEGAAVKNLA